MPAAVSMRRFAELIGYGPRSITQTITRRSSARRDTWIIDDISLGDSRHRLILFCLDDMTLRDVLVDHADRESLARVNESLGYQLKSLKRNLELGLSRRSRPTIIHAEYRERRGNRSLYDVFWYDPRHIAIRTNIVYCFERG